MFDPFMDELKSPQVLPPISDDGCTSVYRVTMTNGKRRLHSQLPADMIALIESPQVCSAKFPTCEQRSVYRLTSAGGGASQGFGGGVVVS